MQQTIQIPTPAHSGLYDITRQVEAIVSESGVQTGLVNVYVQGATAAIMIQFYMIAPLINIFESLSLSLGHSLLKEKNPGLFDGIHRVTSLLAPVTGNYIINV